ncbi:MAG: transglycosylase SLT domain-containing protein [Chloroflexi bacterium]|nr:transglycosylase SLT domain-containing protein [Chloroflexota bacterium]MBV9602095.1 transglycosylase SLT domain-containing protein [Chloroflexota bacterium]
MKLLVGLVGGFAALFAALVLMVISVIAAMPWLSVGVPDGAPPMVHVSLPVGVLPAPAQPSGPNVAIVPASIPAGFFSDLDRFQLALEVGFSPAEAVFATAVSIAENGRGDPLVISPPNHDHSVDIGLWQINSSHAAAFGGIQALLDPLTNARAARTLYLQGGWFLWCTFPGGCGGGSGSPSWPQALARALAAGRAAGN